MDLVTKHILLPGLAPAAIVALYFTPVVWVGCANRGLMAVSVALVAGLAGVVTGVIAVRTKAQKHPSSEWWLLSTVILALPSVLLLGPLG